MSFDQQERHRERGAPVELYLFDYGGGEAQTFRYTNAVQDMAFGGGVFKRIPINRTNLRSDGKFDKSQVTISIPVTTDLAGLFLPYPPPGVVRCRIWQGHLSDPDNAFQVVWHGRTMSVSREGNVAKLTCDSAILSYKRQALRRFYQHGCPLVLYGPRCRADKQAARFDVQVVEVQTNQLILPPNWNGATPTEQFRGGILEWNSELGAEKRMITQIGPNSLSMNGYIRGIQAGDTIHIFKGCGHNLNDCTNIHHNTNNYGGQPWIPFKNPSKQHPFW